MQVKDFLKQSTCKECCDDDSRTPITIDSKANVNEACQVLASNGISSAPVLDAFDHALKGSFDYRDFCAMLVNTFESNEHSYGHFLKPDVQLQELVASGKAGDASVTLVTDFCKKNPLAFLKESDPIYDAVEHYLGDLHRVCLVDSNGKFVRVFSQSDVIKFLHAHQSQLSFSLWEKSVGELGIINRSVVSIDWSRSVMEALCLMQKENSSSIALVDEEGGLASVFSMTDVKYVLRSKNYEALQFSCHDYISSVRTAETFERHAGKDVYPFFGVKEGTSFKRAIGKLVATRAHRLFVIDADQTPVGVIALTDILRTLVQ